MEVLDMYERDIKEAGALLARLQNDLQAAIELRDLAVSRGRGDQGNSLDVAWSTTADAAHELVKRLTAAVARLGDRIAEMRQRQAEYLRHKADEAAKRADGERDEASGINPHYRAS